MKEKVEAIVLAAGYSSRFPEFKPLIKFGNKTLLERTIDNLYDVCSRIIVVCGFRADDIKKILVKYEKADIVINENYSEGMFSSILAGAKQIKGDRFFVVPADMPLIKEKTYIHLLEENKDIVIPVYKKKKGHPVLMKSKIISELLKEEKDSNFSKFIKKKNFKILEVDDAGILTDIDTYEDFEKIKFK
ncbi:MAG TPA: nucleotidyltransferase family protein [Ignavibacteria bacterium]